VSTFQLFSAVAALFLTVVWVVIVARQRLWSVVVVGALSLLLPAFGFAVYARQPGQSPPGDAVWFLVGLLYLAMFLMLAWRFTVGRSRRPSSVIFPAAIETQRYARAVVGRSLLVVWVSVLLFLFEPAFALANLALNAAWMAIWIPRRSRMRELQSSVQVAVPPERAFEFVTDLRNWPFYRDDVEVVEVTPDGPLAAGSEYVVRTLIPPSLRRTSHRQIESRHRVSAMVPGSSYTVAFPDQPGNVSRTDFAPIDSGTLITNTRSLRVPFPQASVGTLLNFHHTVEAIRAGEARKNTRLKEILEQARSQ
jgi:hypothetical protein